MTLIEETYEKFKHSDQLQNELYDFKRQFKDISYLLQQLKPSTRKRRNIIGTFLNKIGGTPTEEDLKLIYDFETDTKQIFSNQIKINEQLQDHMNKVIDRINTLNTNKGFTDIIIHNQLIYNHLMELRTMLTEILETIQLAEKQVIITNLIQEDTLSEITKTLQKANVTINHIWEINQFLEVITANTNQNLFIIFKLLIPKQKLDSFKIIPLEYQNKTIKPIKNNILTNKNSYYYTNKDKIVIKPEDLTLINEETCIPMLIKKEQKIKCNYTDNYTFQEIIAVNTILIQETQLTLKLDCENNTRTLSGTYLIETECQVQINDQIILRQPTNFIIESPTYSKTHVEHLEKIDKVDINQLILNQQIYQQKMKIIIITGSSITIIIIGIIITFIVYKFIKLFHNKKQEIVMKQEQIPMNPLSKFG